MEYEKKILILGVGNLLLKDEGVGIHALAAIEKELTLPPCIHVLDGGTGGVFLIGTLQEYDHLILIDASLEKSPPGTVRRIKPKYSTDYPLLLSAHEIGLKEMIEAMMIQEKIPEIDLITISVQEYGELGMSLSPEAKRSIPEIIQLTKNILSEILKCYV